MLGALQQHFVVLSPICCGRDPKPSLSHGLTGPNNFQDSVQKMQRGTPAHRCHGQEPCAIPRPRGSSEAGWKGGEATTSELSAHGSSEGALLRCLSKPLHCLLRILVSSHGIFFGNVGSWSRTGRSLQPQRALVSDGLGPGVAVLSEALARLRRRFTQRENCFPLGRFAEQQGLTCERGRHARAGLSHAVPSIPLARGICSATKELPAILKEWKVRVASLRGVFGACGLLRPAAACRLSDVSEGQQPHMHASSATAKKALRSSCDPSESSWSCAVHQGRAPEVRCYCGHGSAAAPLAGKAP